MFWVYTNPDDIKSEKIVRILVQAAVPFKNISLQGNIPARKFLDENGYEGAPHLFDGNIYVGHTEKEVKVYLQKRVS